MTTAMLWLRFSESLHGLAVVQVVLLQLPDVLHCWVRLLYSGLSYSPLRGCDDKVALCYGNMRTAHSTKCASTTPSYM